MNFLINKIDFLFLLSVFLFCLLTIFNLNSSFEKDLIKYNYLNVASVGILQPDRIRESVDTVKIYVSNSEGNDNNNGLSPSNPVKTINKGMSLLRDGYPDWLLLKRGDVWILDSQINWNKSGRSASEPVVMTAYGSGNRPLLQRNNGLIWRIQTNKRDVYVNYVWLDGIHAENTSTTAADKNGILIKGPGTDIVVQNVVVEGFATNIVIEGVKEWPEALPTRITIRNSFILDASATGGHSQGLYAASARDLYIENNVFDHNGWSETLNRKQTIFNHNNYLQQTLYGEILFKNNLVMRGSSHGVQARSGGMVEGNVFIRNPLGILLGGGTEPVEGGVVGEVKNNLVLLAGDIDGDKRGLGVDLNNIKDARVTGNVIAHADTFHAQGGKAIIFGLDPNYPIRKIRVDNNTIYQHGRGIIIENTGEVTDSAVIENNTINPGGKSGGVSLNTESIVNSNSQDSGPPPRFSFSNNRYFLPSGVNQFFNSISRGSLTFDQWKTSIEPTATLLSASVTVPTLADYLQSKGYANEAAFYAAARNGQVSVADMLVYFKVGQTPTTPPPTTPPPTTPPPTTPPPTTPPPTTPPPTTPPPTTPPPTTCITNKYYRDKDMDGYGDYNNSINSCFKPDGYTDNSKDCNDGVKAKNLCWFTCNIPFRIKSDSCYSIINN